MPELSIEQDLFHDFRDEGVDYSLFASAPVSETISRVRLPEFETYGRSLSTIHRLGAFMVNKSLPETINSPEADQARVEFYASVEEGFGTDMELGGGLEVRDFDRRPVINGRVMSKDLKTAVSDMTEAGLKCAVETGQKDKRFLPQLTRSKWDNENALNVDAMARGETGYNTIIVVSPFPEEAAKQSGDEYWRNIGYAPNQRRGFAQLYHAVTGEVVSGSLSFNGSDKQKLREVFAKRGKDIPEDEITDNWLQYAITGTFTEEEAKELALAIADEAGDQAGKKTTNTVDVTAEHKPIMDSVFDESYVHICESLFRGRQTEGVKGLVHQFANKAHHLNDRYTRSLYRMRSNEDQFTDDDSIVLHELLVYSTIEMMRSLHLKKTEVHHNNHNEIISLAPTYPQSMSVAEFQNALIGFGAEGAKNGRTYSACGLSISLGGSNLGEGPQSAFGGVDSKDRLPDDKLGSRYFSCPTCGKENERKHKNELLPKCLHCNSDVSCGKEKAITESPKRNSIKAGKGLFALAA